MQAAAPWIVIIEKHFITLKECNLFDKQIFKVYN